MDSTQLSLDARRLGAALEPIIGQVYFSKECHANYVALGFGPSLGDFNGVPAPDGAAYFCSRGSLLGQVPGELIAAAFAVFNPAAVVPAVTYGWTLTDAKTICAARDDGAIAQLHRVIGEQPNGAQRASEILQAAVASLRPEGRPLFAGALSQTTPDSVVGKVWRLGDMLREYRGDSHTAAWISAGLDATEIGLISELYWGLPMRSYSRTRAWTDADFDAATERLMSRAIVADGALTPFGRQMREDIEIQTDEQMRTMAISLGDRLHEVCDIIEPWGAAVRVARGYPAAGPHDLAKAAGS
ncbi:MAG: hypothetical protein EXQ63_04340 [Ilumatobacteraceae bacterium]|nr:hypothetical protein [Ilumatobacteraceae bacterium]